VFEEEAMDFFVAFDDIELVLIEKKIEPLFFCGF
jgi:hypothetical protein